MTETQKCGENENNCFFFTFTTKTTVIFASCPGILAVEAVFQGTFLCGVSRGVKVLSHDIFAADRTLTYFMLVDPTLRATFIFEWLLWYKLYAVRNLYRRKI